MDEKTEAENQVSYMHVNKGRQTFFYSEKSSQSSWFVPVSDIELMVNVVEKFVLALTFVTTADI